MLSNTPIHSSPITKRETGFFTHNEAVSVRHLLDVENDPLITQMPDSSFHLLVTNTFCMAEKFDIFSNLSEEVKSAFQRKLKLIILLQWKAY